MTEYKKEIKEQLIAERNSLRTMAGKLTSIYTDFKKKCLDEGIDYKRGLELAIRLWLKSN